MRPNRKHQVTTTSGSRPLAMITFFLFLAFSQLCACGAFTASDHLVATKNRARAITTGRSAEKAKIRSLDAVLFAQTSPETEEVTTTTTTLNLSQLEQQLASCQSGTTARRVLESALPDDSSSGRLYKSITIPPDSSAKGMSDGDLAIMTRIRNTRYNIMELIDLNGNRDADRSALAVFSVFVGSTLSALVANENLPGPEILRFLVVWIFSFAPLGLVGYGIATPDQLQTTLVSLQRLLFPAYRQRMLQHEAGHFLMAHLLGYPIAEYQANAVKNAVTFYPLNDPDLGTDRARLLGFDQAKPSQTTDNDPAAPVAVPDRPFFSPEGRGGQTINQQSVFRKEQQKTNYTAFLTLDKTNEPRESWPFRGFDDATLDQFTVISVAGVAAEILAFGNAEGGLADFNQLKQLFQSAERDEPLTDREMENRIRFGLGYSMSQLRRHLGALDKLADVMARDGSIAECVSAIETCDNVSGNDGILEEYEIRRKEQFQQQNAALKVLEPLLLGEVKTADVEEDRYVEGKGGGYKKQKFVLTGDDPFYLALGVSAVFLIWASSGGLTLH